MESQLQNRVAALIWLSMYAIWRVLPAFLGSSRLPRNKHPLGCSLLVSFQSYFIFSLCYIFVALVHIVPFCTERVHNFWITNDVLANLWELITQSLQRYFHKQKSLRASFFFNERLILVFKDKRFKSYVWLKANKFSEHTIWLGVGGQFFDLFPMPRRNYNEATKSQAFFIGFRRILDKIILCFSLFSSFFLLLRSFSVLTVFSFAYLAHSCCRMNSTSPLS